MEFVVKSVQVVAADFKGGYASGAVLDPDAAQITTLAQEECTDEDVRRLVMLDINHLLSCFFPGDTIEKESGFKGIYPSEASFAGHQLPKLCRV